MNTIRLETWHTQKGTVPKIVVRRGDGTFHGATNFRQIAKVGQVSRNRRNDRRK